MMLTVQRQVHDAIADVIRRQYSITDIPSFAIEVPPTRAMGDLAVTVAFQLARTLRKPPKAIANEIAAAAPTIPGVDRMAAAANGYLNVYLDRAGYLLPRVREQVPLERADDDLHSKVIVEHTAINPNKAAHVGHLRNAALGDTLARVLRYRGAPLEVQNYIDDLGVQVADVIVGFRVLEGRTIEEIRGVADSTRFDYYCWDLYSRVTVWYEGDPSRLEARATTLHDLEHHVEPSAAIGAFIVDRIVRAHLATMSRLNIAYDLLTYEGDILRLHFWARAFEILKARGAVFLQTEGKLAGCWVMRIQEAGAGGAGAPSAVRRERGPQAASSAGWGAGGVAGAGAPSAVRRERGPQAASSAGWGAGGVAGARPERLGVGPQAVSEDDSDKGDDRVDEQAADESREKVIVRSNGVVTYIGKDLANQFWKLGLLGRDFNYRLFGTQADHRPLWSTTSGIGDPGAPAFGRASRIYNVIDSRQMYLQALLVQALRQLGHDKEAEQSIHFSYEMVALSHATARELGYESDAPTKDGENPDKPFVEVSGRKGLGVKIDDLLDLLTEKASAEVTKRNPEMPSEDCQRTGRQIAVAAIRYFMLKFSRGKLIVFDMEEALSFEGETGPYLQYAVVRANNIFHKLQEREGLSEEDVIRLLDETATAELAEDDLWALSFEASRLDDVLEQVVRALEFSVLAKYAFGLAQMFNAFYHRYPILAEERADRKRWRAAAVQYVRLQLTRALDLMGIEVPARM